jgi:peptidoglycan hydrolase-like protein with peptidoglycan-binding domain
LSFGDGVHAYEARSSSSRPNCGLFATNAGSWTAAFLVPGVNYNGGVDVLPTEPGSDLHQRAIVDVRATRYDGSPARLGSLGWEVECIQFALTYFHEIVTDVDGDFGPQTHANVIEFQTGIRRSRPNGVVGRVEWVKLGLTSDRVA